MSKKNNTTRLMALFAGSEEAHGTHGTPRRAPDSLKWEIKSTAKTLKEPVTIELWEQHLAGKRPLGIITIRKDSQIKHASIDYDVYDANLLELIERVESLKLPLVPVRSKSGGLHLFLFLEEWTPAVSVQTVLIDFSARLGIAGSEIFPKQTSVLVERGDVGNWMVMPYFGSTYDGKIHEQVGLKKTGAEMSLGEFLTVAEGMKTNVEQLAGLTRKRHTHSGNGRKTASGGDTDEPTVPFGDGPPCLQTLAGEKVQKGGGSNTLMHMGVYYKKKYPVGWQEHLEAAARDFLDPPGSEEGTASVIKSLEKKDYQYLCKTQPMCDHCNASLCRTRRFGIGEAGNTPLLTGLSKLASDPPVWFVNIQGTEDRLELSTEQLQIYLLFHRACMEKLDMMFQPMKQMDWFTMVRAVMDKVVPVEDFEVTPDLHSKGKFHELVEEFCTNRQKGDRLEDLLSGRPWQNEEDGRHYFRLRDLESFISREGIKNMTRGQIASKIKNMGGRPKFFLIKSHGTRTWSVDKDMLSEIPEISTPNKKEAGI